MDSTIFPDIEEKGSAFRKLIPQLSFSRAWKYAFALCLILVVLSVIWFNNKREPGKVTREIAIKQEHKKAKKLVRKVKPIIESAVKEKKVKWCFAAEGALRSQPAIKNGYLYFGSDDKVINSAPVVKDDYIYIASADKNLYKFHYKTGELIWKKEIGKLVLSRFFIDNSGIYLANSTGEIIALNLDGEKFWNKEMNIEVYSSVSGDKDNIYFGTVKGAIYSLSKNNGEIVWQNSTDSRFLSSRPLVVDNQLIIGDVSGILYSLNKSNGQPNWIFITGYQITADPIYINQKIYFASDRLYCLDKKGKKEWDFTTSAPVDTNPGICENIITLIDTQNNIYSVNIKSRSCIKKSNPEEMILSFAFACNEIYAGNRKGEICVLK